MNCCARARSSTSTTGSSPSTGRRPGCGRSCPRRGSPPPTARCRSRPLEQVVVDFWEKKFDVLVSTTIVESGIDISNANTLIVERGDNFGLSQLHQLRGRVGPWPRARLRVLPVPAGEAADRDRARAARDHRPAHRDGRGHVRRDEGPGDPRRGQPPRRRTVRPHRGRRLRPVRPHGRRGRRGLPGRPGGRRWRRSRRWRSRSSCRSTRTSRTTTRPASGCASQAYRAIASANSEEDVKAVREELVDRYGKLPEPVENLLLVAGLRMLAAGLRRRRHRPPGHQHPLRAGGVARVAGAAAQAALPADRSSSRPRTRSSSRARRRRRSAGSRWSGGNCSAGPGSS